jgi:hypothetical protein
MSLPENHLDVVVTAGSVDARRRIPVRTVVLAVVSLPLFFMLCFTLAYTSALHTPKPHDFPLTIAGTLSTTREISKAIDKRAPGAFDITHTTSLSEARKRVEDRTADGAVLVNGRTVTTVIASGGGLLSAQVVEEVGRQVASSLGTTTKVVDIAKLTSGDTTGSSLFFFIIVCTIGGYLSITVLSQVLPKAQARTQLLTSAGAGIVVPILGFAAISLFAGDYNSTFGTIAAVLGVGMIYTFMVGVLASFFTRLLNQGAIFGVVLFILALNFPSTGGGNPEGLLPPFWQVVHNGWFGSAAMEAVRSIVYFHGEQVGHWLLLLGIWTVAVLVITMLFSNLQSRRKRFAIAIPPAMVAPPMSSSPVHEATH